jgi:hypothetical protein
MSLGDQGLVDEAVDGAPDRDPVPGRPEGEELAQPVGVVGVDDEQCGARVVEDVPDLAHGQGRVEGDVEQSALLGGHLPGDDVDPVGQGQGDHVAGPQAEVAQSPGQPVGTAGQFAEGQPLARRRIEDGGMVGMVVRDPPHTQPLLEGVVLDRHER